MKQKLAIVSFAMAVLVAAGLLHQRVPQRRRPSATTIALEP